MMEVRKMNWQRACTMAALLLCVWPSQAFYIRVHGLVTEYFSGDGMRDVQVRLVKDSVERETIFTNWKGEYEIFLERGYDYQVWYYRKDLVPKYVRIDAECRSSRMCRSTKWTCR